MTASLSTSPHQPKRRTEFFYPITESAKNALWPKHNAGLGLYINLVGLVTVEIPDPDDAERRIGIILSGTQLTDIDLAARVGCDRVKLRYEKGILLKLGILIQRRYSSSYRLAIRYSAKGCQQSAMAPKYAWVGEAIEKSKKSQNRVKRNSLGQANQAAPDSMNCVEPDSLAVERNSLAVEPDSHCLPAQQNQQDESPYKIVDKKEEERDESKPKSSPLYSLNSTPTPTTTPTPNLDLDAVCSKLYTIGRKANPCQSPFSGKQRDGIAELLTIYPADELIDAYADYVKNRDDFEMRHAPKRFVEGGAVQIITSTRDSKRVADQRRSEHDMLVAKWRQRQIDEHRAKLEKDQLELQEQGGRKEPEGSPLYERYHLAMKIRSSGIMASPEDREKLRKLRAEAAKEPAMKDFVDFLVASKPFEPGLCNLNDYSLREMFPKMEAR
jgi:hypothetical protein